MVGEGFEDSAGTVRTIREQDGKGVFHGLDAEVGLAGVAVDAVKKRSEIDELVTRFDELEIEDFLFARHGWRFGARWLRVNGEEAHGDRQKRGLFHRMTRRGFVESLRMNPLTLNAPPLLDAVALDEQDAIRRTVRLLDGCPDVTNATSFLKEVFERQRINPPVLGNGVAIPHARTSSVKEIVCVVARLKEAVEFGDEGTPVRLVFLFGIPPHRISQYLAAMAGLVKRLRKPDVLDGLLSADNVRDFLRYLD